VSPSGGPDAGVMAARTGPSGSAARGSVTAARPGLSLATRPLGGRPARGKRVAVGFTAPSLRENLLNSSERSVAPIARKLTCLVSGGPLKASERNRTYENSRSGTQVQISILEITFRRDLFDVRKRNAHNETVCETVDRMLGGISYGRSLLSP
jgi:hypothetical protein